MSDDRDKAILSVLEKYRMSYKNGDNAALLDAVKYCGQYSLVMPAWVSSGFVNCYNKWLHSNVRTLDEAFNLKRTESFHKTKKWTDKAFDVALEMAQANSRDTNCAELVAKKHGINRDDTWRMFKEVKNSELGRGILKAADKRTVKPKN